MTPTQYEMLSLKLKEAHEILCQAGNDEIVVKLKNAVEHSLVLLAVSQCFVATAVGENLDRLAMQHNLERAGKSDDEFREFIKEKLYMNATEEGGTDESQTRKPH